MKNTGDAANTHSEFGDQWYDLQTFSKRTCLSVKTLRKHLKKGLPHYKVGGKYLIRRSEGDFWVESFKVDVSSEVDAVVKEILESVSN